MFGLWYLSLAISELRKRLGWTSIFDIFKGNKNAGNKAIEPKPGSSSEKPEVPTVPKKVPETKPKPEEPAKVEPPKPVVVPTPVVEPNKSVPEPKPVPAKLPEPKVEIPKPVVAEPKPSVPKSPEPQTKPAVPETKPVVTKPETPKTIPETKPAQSKPEPPKTVVPTPQTDSSINKPKVPSSASNIEPAWMNNGLDRKSNLVNSPQAFENGGGSFNGDTNAKSRSNVKDATTSFLQGEGAGSNLNQRTAIDKRNKSDTMVDAAVLQKMEEGFAKLQASDSKSLLKKYLTKEVFDSLKNKKTPTFGSTLLDCIQSGLENHDSGVGIYAPDAEAYSVFSELFDPIIEDYHTGFKKTDKHPARDFGDVSVFGNVDPDNEFVVSTRVRCGRSMEGYPFNPCLTEAQYKEMEEKVSSTLSGLEGELKGKFYPLTGMEKAVQQQLIDDHFLFKEGDRFLQSANACRFWPSGRGIYHNENKRFLVWCNEEDHLRIISMQMGGDLGEIYRRLVTAVNDIEKRIPFSHHDRLGFLTFCPTNLGTTIRASVHIKLPKLAANKAKLEEVASKYNLQVRGTRGEHTEAEGGVYDISNKRRMGLTEFDAVKEMYDGITELIKIEKSM